MPDYRLGRLKGQFVVVWEEAGRRRRYRLGTRDPKEARSTLHSFVRERERISQSPLDVRAITVEAIWHDYIKEKQAEGKVSVTRMADAWKRLAASFGGVSPGDLSSGCVRDYTASRRGQGASDGTIHVELGYLRAALRYSLKGNAPDITLPPKPRGRTRYLTPDEARKLIDACAMPHVRLYVLLALYTAGRPSALLDLSWDRVDFRMGRISLDNPARDRTAKGRATVPLAPAIRDDLGAARSVAITEWVIEWAGKRVGSIKKAISRAAQRAGLEGVTPYVLRHTSARWMVEGGVPITEVAQYLGHTSPAVTYRVYGRYSPDYLQGAAQVIQETLVARTRRREPLGDEK